LYRWPHNGQSKIDHGELLKGGQEYNKMAKIIKTYGKQIGEKRKGGFW